jgi:hypothetical protein
MTDDTFLSPSLGSLLFVAALLVLICSSPLVRSATTAFVLCAPVVVTVLVFWATQTNVVPRFFSFLLVPLFMLTASGSASILARITTRPPLLRTIVVVGVLATITVASAPLVWAIPREPRQAHREVAEIIRRLAPSVPVYAHVPYPGDLEYHLGRRVIRVYTHDAAARMCRSKRRVAYVDQSWLIRPITPTCLRRTGVEHFHFDQYARGKTIELWLLPPR